MLRATPCEIARATGARLVCGPGEREVAGVTTDSRAVTPGCLFVAIKGERVDGNDFAAKAVEAGAGAVALTRDADEALRAAAEAAGAALVRADDAVDFLLALASWWRGRLDCAVVGITGSSGKSTTKEMTAAVLSTSFRTHATAGNLNSLIGAPLTVLSCPLDAEALVVEMGMNAAGEIERIARCARPHVGVVTNVGVAHIGLLGSRRAIAAAKAELVAELPASGPVSEPASGPASASPGAGAGAGGRFPSCAVLWGEDDFTGWIETEVAAPRGVRVLRFGTEPSDDASCVGFALDGRGCASGRVGLPSGASFDLALNLPGAHNVNDALAAATVGDLLGVGPERIAEALAGVRPMEMRLQVHAAPGGFTVVDDSYNANADSMRRAVDVLCSLSASRRVACLGDMGELGDSAAAMHAAIGAYVAAKPVDALVAVGPLSRTMAEAARLMGMGEDAVVEVDDADAASRALRDVLRPGDALLVKASRSVGLDRTVKAVMGPWA